MNGAEYIVRFDDICSTMRWKSWDKIEKLIISLDIKPIVAVVPDNKDEFLIVSEENSEFWSRVRLWKKLGWSIAIHGYQHRYRTKSSGLMKLNTYREFAGLSYEKQRDYLQKSIGIFEKNGVTPDLWVAPAHSFDRVTLKALFDLGIKKVSDGFFFRPVKSLEMTWIPQQLWKFRDFGFGIWTVCFHINNLNETQLNNLCDDLERYKENISSVDEVLENIHVREKNLIDYCFMFIWRKMVKSKRLMGRLN